MHRQMERERESESGCERKEKGEMETEMVDGKVKGLGRRKRMSTE